ncbi:MAG: hypothetical protein ACYCU0_06850 [Solirubrobacteraceae bacterium]
MTSKQFAALFGFAFVAAWIGLGLGDAILCLIGAIVFWGVVSFRRGEIDLADLQSRLGAQRDVISSVAPTRARANGAGAPQPPKRSRRVQ